MSQALRKGGVVSVRPVYRLRRRVRLAVRGRIKPAATRSITVHPIFGSAQSPVHIISAAVIRLSMKTAAKLMSILVNTSAD